MDIQVQISPLQQAHAQDKEHKEEASEKSSEGPKKRKARPQKQPSSSSDEFEERPGPSNRPTVSYFCHCTALPYLSLATSLHCHT